MFQFEGYGVYTGEKFKILHRLPNMHPSWNDIYYVVNNKRVEQIKYIIRSYDFIIEVIAGDRKSYIEFQPHRIIIHYGKKHQIWMSTVGLSDRYIIESINKMTFETSIGNVLL